MQSIYVKLSEDEFAQFQRVKDHLGLKNNTEVIRYLIKERKSTEAKTE